MGRRGPAPTPTKILAARGSWRADERPNEPTPSAETPKCPDWLSVEGRAEWDRICRQLDAMGILAAADRALLVAYCEAWAEFAAMEKLLKKMQPMLKTKKGVWYQNPIIGVRNRAFERLRRAACEFGLSPASRTRVQAAPAKPTSAKLRFFSTSNN